MSNDKARDGDLTRSLTLVENDNNSGNIYEVIDMKTANPDSVYAIRYYNQKTRRSTS